MEIFEKTYYEVAEAKNYGNRTTFVTLEEALAFRKNLKGGEFIVTRKICRRVHDDKGYFVSDKTETHRVAEHKEVK